METYECRISETIYFLKQPNIQGLNECKSMKNLSRSTDLFELMFFLLIMGIQMEEMFKLDWLNGLLTSVICTVSFYLLYLLWLTGLLSSVKCTASFYFLYLLWLTGLLTTVKCTDSFYLLYLLLLSISTNLV
jgi:hypothetical protein